MILDTSAVIAILFKEPEGGRFTNLVYAARECRISAVNFVELLMVTESRVGPQMTRECEIYFQQNNVTIEPVTIEHAYLARQAFLDYGKGRHPAKLNFGDCFAYALAKAARETLLFKGNDFNRTDILPAT